MRIRVLSIGKTNIPFVKEGLNEYTNRINHYLKFSWEELNDVKNGGKLTVEQLRKEEGKLILSQIVASDHLVLLDENGKNFTSVELAEWIDNKMNYNSGRDICFVIGGAFGFSDEIYARSDFKLSLSKMTFSHQIIRVIFTEQIYRALTIIRGERYHHV